MHAWVSYLGSERSPPPIREINARREGLDSTVLESRAVDPVKLIVSVNLNRFN